MTIFSPSEINIPTGLSLFLDLLIQQILRPIPINIRFSLGQTKTQMKHAGLPFFFFLPTLTARGTDRTRWVILVHMNRSTEPLPEVRVADQASFGLWSFWGFRRYGRNG
jgi:hypothetical protein